MSDLTVSPFGELMRTYSFAYTASHDFSVSDRIMVDDYVLRMGPNVISGRTEQYQPATQRQYRQYPGLGFAVHDFVTNGDRAALRFSEFGRSALTANAASWLGISLYRWNGEKLTECRVEQDYFSRSLQSKTGEQLAVPEPAVDPWTADVVPADERSLSLMHNWLVEGSWLRSGDIQLDDEDRAEKCRVALDGAEITVLDSFSAGPTVAFHVAVSGKYAGGLGAEHAGLLGRTGTLYASGIVSAAEDGSVTGHAVTDRLSFSRRLGDAKS
jgi:hypothetical protein